MHREVEVGVEGRLKVEAISARVGHRHRRVERRAALPTSQRTSDTNESLNGRGQTGQVVTVLI